MGMEALAKAAARIRQESAGVSDKEFASQLGIDLERLDPCKRLPTEIEAAVRRKLLFRGDSDCHRDAKKASDGFEHGFMPYDEIRNHAMKVRDSTAAYLREAVLDLLDLDDPCRTTLLSSPFNQPLGDWPVVKYVRGHLVGDSDDLASEQNAYPILSWRSRIASIDISDAGEYKIKLDETFTARLGRGITFRPKSFEVWRP
jgi:hypothetical protein